MNNYYQRTIAFLWAICLSVVSLFAQDAPVGDGKYYIIQFKTGGAAITAGNNNAQMTTANFNVYTASDKQLWTLEGTDAKFQLKNKAGQYAYVDGTAVKARSTTPDAKGWTVSDNQIKWLGTSAARAYINQTGGQGAGKSLALWSAENANKVNFVEAVAFTEDQFFLIKFNSTGMLMTGMNTGEKLKFQSGSIYTATEKQQWSIIGNGAKFQLRNKAGQYAIGKADGYVYASTTEDASGWALDGNQIKWLGTTTSGKVHLNQFGGANDANKFIGFWNNGDNGNQLALVDMNNLPEFYVMGASQLQLEHPMTLWYDRPAIYNGVGNPWMEYSLPIGNGELGASLYGNVKKDEIQFNEKTLWQGAAAGFSGGGGNYGYYRNFGSVFVEDISNTFGFNEATAVKDYSRSLNINNGISRVHYTSANGQTAYDRTYLASAPDGVIAAQYKATGTEKLSVLITVVPGEENGATNPSYTAADNTGQVSFSGAGLQTVKFAAHMRVMTTDGTVTATNKGIKIENASSFVILLAGDTNYHPTNSTYTNGETAAAILARMNATTEKAAQKGFDAIESDHVQDFTSWTNRVNFDIKGSSSLNTEALVKYYNTVKGKANLNDAQARHLEQLYFNYGRYLLISSNRTKDVPNNLQGIWNDKAIAPWHSDIHANINIQMNYWPAEPTNLSELHMPFLNFIINNASMAGWKEAARRTNISKGWTVFTETSIFGGMSTFAQQYAVANAWYCSHLWQHYRYTRDMDYLLRAFPAMWSAAEYWMERLIEDRGYDSASKNAGYKGPAYKFSPDGTLVAPNEYSAEQDSHNSEDGTAHAQQLVYSLFSSVAESIDILQEKAALLPSQIAQLNEKLARLDNGLHTETYQARSNIHSGWTNPRNGVRKGNTILREWKYSPYDVSNDPGHRHMSHLMALYPLSQIDPSSEYFEPAVNSLKLRGDVSTGWSMGWKVNCWARALDGDHAHQIIKNALRHSGSYGTNAGDGGIYYNLYDSHAPFQIDGNFGVCAGIAEMLLQSHSDTLQLLPALPTEWSREGSITGLKAVGNFTVDQKWKDKRLTEATIVSNKGLPCPIIYEGIGDKKVIHTQSGEEIIPTRLNENTIVVPSVEPGTSFTIRMNEQGTLTHIQSPSSKSAYTFSRQGNTIHIDGNRIASLSAYDAAGKLLDTQTRQHTLHVLPGTVVVKITNTEGKVETLKIQ